MRNQTSSSRGMRAFAALAAFHARQLLRTPFFLQLAIAAPLSFGLMRALGSIGSGAAMPATIWLDSAVAGMWATTTTAVGIIGYQRFQGTLEFLAMSTLAPRAVFGSLAAAATLIGWIGVPIGIVLQFAFTGEAIVTANQLLGFAATSVACAASACVLAALFVVTRSATAFEPLILVPIWLLSGLVVPLTRMPGWLQAIALLHPLTSAIEAGRQAETTSGLLWLAVALAASSFWVALAGRFLQAALRRVRVVGTLSLS